MNELELKNLEFGYKKALFLPLDLHCAQGEVCAVLGANGLGKTTLLHTINGLTPQLGGEIKKNCAPAFVPQIFRSNFLYLVRDIVLMGRVSRIGLFHLPSRKDEEIAMNSLERLGIAQLAERPYNTLSGGQRQLVLIARALTMQSRMLILDEPTAALDLKNQKAVLALMRRLAEEGMNVIFTTHDPNHALLLADKVLLLMPDRKWIFGINSTVLTVENLQKAYGVDISLQKIEHNGKVHTAFIPLLSS